MTHGRYRVKGRRPYRGHEPGTIFEARLDPGPERRAIYRGDIELLERVVPALPAERALPQGWAQPRPQPTTTPEGVRTRGG